MFAMNGFAKTTRLPPTMASINVSCKITTASLFARFSSPLPKSVPRYIPAPLAIPLHPTRAKFLTMVAIEFAATMSLQICPRITEYVANADPQLRPFNVIGSV